ncbi:MAG: aromatic ring-hydroxylating dioxygenase subunit alpha [Alphaproteobacteria bacterium]|nr:aromatic ring-hydroxylating dioxygenase subunit alpha [Alphaproteobacteria bacterium]
MNDMTAQSAIEAHPKGLPGHFYYDSEIFGQTRDRIFFKTWQFACHQSLIPEPGDYYAFSILDQDLFVVRQKDRSIRCFYNVCQHRGHQLVESTGRARVITCPYHAWAYGLDGKLRGAVGVTEQTGIKKSEICLTSVRVEDLCGFLFVNLDNAAPSLQETFPGVEDEIRTLAPDIDERVFADQSSADEYCNWLVAVENYNECYHCPGAHPTFASGVIDPKSYSITPFSAQVKCLRHSAKAQTGRTAWYDTSGSDYGSFFLWPGFSLQIYPSGLVNTYHWRPDGPTDTRVYRTWFSHDGVVDDSLQKVIDLDRDTTVAEDLVLVKKVQRGVASRGYVPGPLVIDPENGINSELSIYMLHRWLREALHAG